jgi:hypothetical protein
VPQWESASFGYDVGEYDEKHLIKSGTPEAEKPWVKGSSTATGFEIHSENERKRVW